LKADGQAGQTGVERAAPAKALAGLRVALVHDWLTGRRGGEKCLEVLCEAFPEATLHTLIHRRGAAGPLIEGMRIKTSPLQLVPGALRRYRALLPLMPLAARAWNVGDVDLVVSTSHCVAKAVRVPAGVPHVCYCFTPMRYAWDERAAYLDGWRTRPVRRLVAGWALDRLRDWDRKTVAGVTHFVAISQTVRKRVLRCYGRDSRVIQPPVDVDFYTPAAVDRKPFYLIVSALVPYKRVADAIEACTALGRRLVVIGEGPERERLERLAGKSAEFLGWQPDEVVREHLRRCRALLFPGLEDFGIVPLEALACGAAVIALGEGGAAENVDTQVGRLYAGPGAAALAKAIAAWESEGCPHDAEEGRRRAEALSVGRFRERLLGYLADVVSGRAERSPWLPGPHWAKRVRDSRASRARRAL
jgi:glycosyltransferase involved in cell wall biosynthesis